MKKNGWLKISMSVLLGVAILYLVYQIQAVLNPDYRTETAIYYQMSEKIEMTAAAVFEKQPVEGGGMLGYLAEDGERVHPGQLVAENYASAEQSQAQAQYRQLQKQIELLQKSSNVQGSDIGAITQQLEDGLYTLLTSLESDDYISAVNDFDKYLLAANKIQCLTEKSNGFGDQIAQLKVQMDLLSTTIGNPSPIPSPTSGYFIRNERAGVQPYTKEQLEAASPTELQQLLSQPVGDAPAAVGQIITDYRWAIYGTTNSDLTEQLKTGQKLLLRLPERGGIEFPVKVESVVTDRDANLSKIKLSCENITPEALCLGVERVELIVNQYEGIRVPRIAEHIQTTVDENGDTVEEYGVYVKVGRLMYFREITQKLYENGEYMLLELNPQEENGNEVQLYDEIVVEGIDLEDGKLI